MTLHKGQNKLRNSSPFCGEVRLVEFVLLGNEVDGSEGAHRTQSGGLPLHILTWIHLVIRERE